MTALTADCSINDTIIHLDGAPEVGEFYLLDDEVVLVGGSVTLNYSDVTTGNRWRIRRAQDHTTAATHSSGTPLTVAREFAAAGAGGGAIAVTGTESGEVPAATGLVLPGIVTEDAGVATYQPGIYVQATDPGAVGAGAIWKDISLGSGFDAVWWERNAADDGWAAIAILVAVATGSSDANVAPFASAVDGDAVAGSAAQASGSGDSYAKSTANAVDGDANAESVAYSDNGNANATSLAHAPGVGGTATNGTRAIGPAGTSGMRAVSDATSARMAFNSTTPIAKPTGVAVTAEAIHAALVSLGLIAGP